MCKFSVVTVCFRAEQTIERTLASVLSQSFSDFEYIIKDGGSDDGTMAIVDRYEALFREKNISVTVVSEKDRGIYGAMNEAIAMTRGDWVNFLNAGDVFYDESTLGRIADEIRPDAEILCGRTVVFNSEFDLYRPRPDEPISALPLRMPFCHQSVFVAGDLIRENPFREEYRIGADYDSLLSFYEAGRKFQELPFFVSIYLWGGVSSNDLKMQRDMLRIRRDHGLIDGKTFEALTAESEKRYAASQNTRRRRLERLAPHTMRLARKILRRRSRKIMLNTGWFESAGACR